MGAKKEFNQDTFDTITVRIDEGASVMNACKGSSISASTYGRWKKGLESEGESRVKEKLGLLQQIKALQSAIRDLPKMKRDIEKLKGFMGC